MRPPTNKPRGGIGLYAALRSALDRLSVQAGQSDSHFPAFAQNYKNRLSHALRSRSCPRDARLIAAILSADGNQRCGFQPLALANPRLIRESERWLTTGEFEHFLRSRNKYDEFAARLREEPDFRRDWRALRQAFPRETATTKIIHRTLVPERNWVRDGGAKFATRRQRFQACFDLLCWKYCLWGVGRGRPLLLKPSVAFTPFGTQIFIPAYFSFDAKRDLNLGLITRLHRARGLQRQGEGFSAARTDRMRMRKLALKADAIAAKMRIRGEARYAFIAESVGWTHDVDPRAVRRLLSEARRPARVGK